MMFREMMIKSLKLAAFWSIFSVALLIGFVFIILADGIDINPIMIALAPIGGVGCAVFAVQQWINLFGKKYLRGIKEFCTRSDEPEQMLKRIKDVWNNGFQATKRCRMDSEYFVYGDGEKSVVIPWSNVKKFFSIVLTSVLGRFGRYNYVLEVTITTKDGKKSRLRIITDNGREDVMKKKFNEIESNMIDYIEKNCPGIIDRKLWDVVG
jgi:sporulation protein YlmC with PRC-barrel domain